MGQNDARKKRIVTSEKETLGCETTSLKYRSKRKPPVEPRMTKQQTRLSPVPTNLYKSTTFMLSPPLSLMHDQPAYN